MDRNQTRSYGQILKSSALIGGSSLITVFFSIVRSKLIALLLKEQGVGLLGLYTSVSDLTRTVAGLGINVSGVRQIAETVRTGDTRQIARTVTALRRISFYSGAVGALLLVIFCKPVSWTTFGDYDHAGGVALMGLAVFFADISAGQAALVQGMRRIADLALMNVWGAVYATVFSIPIIWYLGEKGVVPSLVCVAGMGILTSWWYARKVVVERVRMLWRDIFGEAAILLRLGLVFMASALFTMGVADPIRVIIARKLGLVSAGYFQAAWTLGGFYIGFVLQAMGTDFYPRLTGVANDHPECNRLVNEQAEIGLLMAGPGILATLTFAPLLIEIFYSDRFGPAAGTFRWICLGMFIRVVSWPLGFVIVAKGDQKLFFWLEFLSNAVHAAFAWLGVKLCGLEGAGMAFFGLYVCNLIWLNFIVRRLTGFRWSAANLKLGMLLVPLVTIVFISRFLLNFWPAMILNSMVTVAVGIFCVRLLCTLVPVQKLPWPARKMLAWFRLAPAGTGV